MAKDMLVLNIHRQVTNVLFDETNDVCLTLFFFKGRVATLGVNDNAFVVAVGSTGFVRKRASAGSTNDKEAKKGA